jgi:outer membrane immunogenic protein
MIRSVLFSTALLAGFAALAPAGAADLPYGNPYYDNTVSSTVYDWTGPYLGAHLGYGWGSAGPDDLTGPVGGVQAGYAIQNGQFVMGLEADIGLSGLDWSGGGAEASIDALGSFRARAGLAVEQFLIYGTGGFGFGSFTYEGDFSRDDQWNLGWVLGLGAEAALSRNWTARVEALYYDLGSSNYLIGGATRSIDVDAAVLRAGVNYRF